MNKIMTTILITAALAGSRPAQATTVDFYTDGVIESGDYYDSANSYNEAVVDMTGGEVVDFRTYDSSILNFADGIIDILSAYDTSTVNIYGGEIPSNLNAFSSATLNLYGGIITVSHGLLAWESTTVNIYGYGFELSGSGHNYYLSGFWLDGTPFSNLWLRGPETYDHVNLIPETATVFLVALGMIMVRKHKQ